MGPRGDHRGQSISILRQIRQRMPPLPNLVKVRLDHRLWNRVDVRPVPVWLVVLIDQARPDAFAEFRMPAAIEAQGVFHLKDFRQRQVPGAADLLPDQMRGQRATLMQALAGICQQWVVMLLEPFQRAPG